MLRLYCCGPRPAGEASGAVESLQFLHQGRALEIQQPRRLTLVAPRSLERPLNQLTLHARDERVEVDPVIGQQEWRAECGRRRIRKFRGQIGDVDLRLAGAE